MAFESINKCVFFFERLSNSGSAHEIPLCGLSSGDKTIGYTFVYEYTRSSYLYNRACMAVRFGKIAESRDFTSIK